MDVVGFVRCFGTALRAGGALPLYPAGLTHIRGTCSTRGGAQPLHTFPVASPSPAAAEDYGSRQRTA